MVLKCPRIRKVSYKTLYGGCKGKPNAMNHSKIGTLPKGYKKADRCLELQRLSPQDVQMR